MSVSEIIDKSSKEVVNNRDRVKSEGPGKSNDVQEVPVSKTEHKYDSPNYLAYFLINILELRKTTLKGFRRTLCPN